MTSPGDCRCRRIAPIAARGSTTCAARCRCRTAAASTSATDASRSDSSGSVEECPRVVSGRCAPILTAASARPPSTRRNHPLARRVPDLRPGRGVSRGPHASHGHAPPVSSVPRALALRPSAVLRGPAPPPPAPHGPAQAGRSPRRLGPAGAWTPEQLAQTGWRPPAGRRESSLGGGDECQGEHDGGCHEGAGGDGRCPGGAQAGQPA